MLCFSDWFCRVCLCFVVDDVAVVLILSAVVLCCVVLCCVQATLHDGAVGTVQHAVRVTDSQGDVLSPWHDVPLRVADSHLVNFVAEIPKG